MTLNKACGVCNSDNIENFDYCMPQLQSISGVIEV